MSATNPNRRLELESTTVELLEPFPLDVRETALRLALGFAPTMHRRDWELLVVVIAEGLNQERKRIGEQAATLERLRIEHAGLRASAWALVRSLDGAIIMYRDRENAEEVPGLVHALHVRLLSGEEPSEEPPHALG